ncbi:unnamed protein product [Schistosoma rodhaini]|nr:unnamed protein product [Schistosoma rodhaini]
MRINSLFNNLLNITMVIIIIIIHHMKLFNTESWQTTLRLAKRHTQHYDIDILKTALDNYVYKMNNEKYHQRTIHLNNITNGYQNNLTSFHNELDDNNELILTNYSSDTNAITDDNQETNYKNYFLDQTIQNSKSTNLKSSSFKRVHTSSNSSFIWNILQFSFGLLCFIVHVTWFIWLICHTVLFKICQQTSSSQFLTVSHSRIRQMNESDLFVKHYQLTIHSELHLGFVGTIYGFIISMKQLSSPLIDPKSTTTLDQTNLIHRNYLLCYFTRHILLGLLTVYWITIFIIILINTHYIKSISLMNTSTIPFIHNVFVILYISFIISWIFSIVLRISNLLINYNLQKFTMKHLTHSNPTPIKQILNFECILTKNFEYQKLYFYTICNQTTIEQWIEIVTNILSDILPNFLVFSISIFNCFLSFKLRNHSMKQIIKSLTCNNNTTHNSNNNSSNDTNNHNGNLMKLDNLSKELRCSPQIDKDSTIITELCNNTSTTTTTTSSYLTYQCDLSVQHPRRQYQSEDHVHDKQTLQLNKIKKIYQIFYFSISLIILSLCLLINHFIRLIIYGNLMRSQMNYCDSWNFNQGLHESDNMELFQLVHEHLHIPHQYLQGCILMEIFITTFVPIICFTLRRCHNLFYLSCCRIHEPSDLKQILNKDICSGNSEISYDKSIKMDYINLSKLAVPIGSHISSTTIDDLGNQSTITASLSSTTQCCQSSTDTIIPPCELLKLQTFTRAQFKQKPQMLIDKESYLRPIYTNLPTCSNEMLEQNTTTTFVPVSIKLVNLQPLCCQPCDIFTGSTKILSKPDDTVIECEYLNNNCIYPIETTGSVVKLHVVSDSSGYGE